MRRCGIQEGLVVVDKFEEAIDELHSRCECRVEQCVFPTNGWVTYYISEDARCFGVRQYKLNGKWEVYELSLATDKYKPDMLPKFLLRPDFGHQVGVRADRMVYCTFVLKEWDGKLKLAYKDGCKYNCKLENLYIEGEGDGTGAVERMQKYQSFYKQYFNDVAEYTYFLCRRISRDDAKDAAQEAFLWLMTKDYDINLGLWMKYAKLTGMTIVGKIVNTEGFEDWKVSLWDKAYEIDVTQYISNESARQYFEMYLQGYEQHEIMRMLGVERSLLSYHVRHSRKIIKEELSKDIKWLMLG